MRKVFFVLLLLSAAPVSAQSLKIPTTVFATSAAADWTTTYVTTTRMGLNEQNPLINRLQRNHGKLMIAAGAGLDVAGVLAWNHFVGKRHPRAAQIGLYTATAMRLFLATRNVQYGRAKVRSWRSH